jgi:ABC-type multidrug transport system fused ATPase/permease subunit
MSSDDVTAAIDSASPIDEETAEDIQDAATQADEDVTDRQRWWAFAQLAAIFGLVAVAIGLAIYFDVVALSLSVSAAVSIGWIIEYLVLGFVVAFLLYLAMLLLIAAPGSLISLGASVAYGIAESQGLVDNEA